MQGTGETLCEDKASQSHSCEMWARLLYMEAFFFLFLLIIWKPFVY